MSRTQGPTAADPPPGQSTAPAPAGTAAAVRAAAPALRVPVPAGPGQRYGYQPQDPSQQYDGRSRGASTPMGAYAAVATVPGAGHHRLLVWRSVVVFSVVLFRLGVVVGQLMVNTNIVRRTRPSSSRPS